jgi:hypothetical protein
MTSMTTTTMTMIKGQCPPATPSPALAEVDKHDGNNNNNDQRTMPPVLPLPRGVVNLACTWQ